uniref:RNA helicase n=1 Tax=Actinia tenebrosa TaxID=6105 RepID=A0A6P8HX19_ACTTE
MADKMAAFVPRAVRRKDGKNNIKNSLKRKPTSQEKQEKSKVHIVDLREKCNSAASIPIPDKVSKENANLEDDDEEEVEEEIVSYSKNQRWPDQDEPVCVVCGRYGAYICDETEKDVCSLECKAKHLKTLGISVKTLISSPKQFQDETTNICSLSTSSNSELNYNESDVGTENLSFQNYKFKEHPTISSLSETKVQHLLKSLEIQTKGNNVTKPILEFFHCQFDKLLSENITKCGYFSPTPIQMQLIPVALSGRDIIACAQTGSGKTAAFLLPMIARIHSITDKLLPKSALLRTPLGLVLAPTRELCMQIEDQAKEFMQGLSNMRTALLVGGMPLPPQIHRIQMGVQIIVATPGRLLEILSKVNLDLTNVKCLVVDEVDSMFQLGFEQQVQQILENLNEAKQTMMTSATIPPNVETMASKLLRDPAFISVGNPNAPTQAVKQLVLWVEEKSKKKHLFSILNDSKHFKPPVVVFVDSKIGADMLAEAIQKMCKIPCVAMHGDKKQEERTQILQSFISGEYPVIVCTGVLGRGVDLLNVKQVINFDMPASIEEYIHQVGRAGRLGTSGWAVTFINNQNKHLFLDLIETLSPLGVSLPSELTNSFYAKQQKERKKQKAKDEKDEIVHQGNLIDLLKKSTERRKKR